MKKNFKYLFMFLALITGALVMSSCSKDDDDDKNESKPSTEESVTSSIVGTWRCVNSDGDYHFESIMTLYSNGKYSGETEETYPGGHDYSEVSGTYTYSEKTNKLTIVTTSASDAELIGTETYTVIWNGSSSFNVKNSDGDTFLYKKIK